MGEHINEPMRVLFNYEKLRDDLMKNSGGS